MDPSPPDGVPQHSIHWRAARLPKRIRTILFEHKKVLSHHASCLSELIRVQGQVQICRFKHATAATENLRIEHNKVAAVVFAVAAF
jgi:hypothetical protein